MTSDRTILITGVTGNQGGAVAQALQGTGFHLRGLTRMPDSERAAARWRATASTSSRAISMTRRRCAVRWPACGASSACRTR
jgi:nucleoside-diphosphate-sugar epimerase